VKSGGSGKQTARQAGIDAGPSHRLMTGGVAVTAAVFADDADAFQMTATRTEAVRHPNGHLADAWPDAGIYCAVAISFYDTSGITRC